MPRIRPLAFRAALSSAVLAPLLVVSGCSGDQPAPSSDKVRESAAAGRPDRPATVDVTSGGARAGEPIALTARGGTLVSVEVAGAGGRDFAGTISSDRRVWTSRRVTTPGVSYAIRARTRTANGTTRETTASVRTAPAARVNTVDWRPGAGGVVGVAQPVSLVFDRPVRNKRQVEEQLRICTSNATEGSWGWMRDRTGRDRVDWRPREYWKPGTEVTLDARLNGVDAGPEGGFFVRDYTVRFTVGSRQVVKVDLDR